MRLGLRLTSNMRTSPRLFKSLSVRLWLRSEVLWYHLNTPLLGNEMPLLDLWSTWVQSFVLSQRGPWSNFRLINLNNTRIGTELLLRPEALLRLKTTLERKALVFSFLRPAYFQYNSHRAHRHYPKNGFLWRKRQRLSDLYGSLYWPESMTHGQEWHRCFDAPTQCAITDRIIARTAFHAEGNMTGLHC